MASTYLTRSNGTPTSQQIFTFSAWVKRSGLNPSGNNMELFSQYNDTSNRMDFRFQTGDTIDFYHTSSLGRITTNRLFRDTSAWYHIVLRVDTTQATSSDRYRLYINGVQETSFSTATYPSQNANLGTNFSTFSIGDDSYGSGDFDGCMTHIYYTDGQSYDADTFGETDATTGIWKPKTAPSVTYGTNGFFLKFENSGAFGTDSSGNGNNFTVNGTMTQTIDTPSNVFCTWNALDKHASSTLSNGNTKYATSGTSQYEPAKCTLGFSSGKYYSEHQINSLSTTACFIGIYGTSVSGQSQSEMDTSRFCYNVQNGEIIKNASNLQTGLATFTTNDILGIEVDCDAGTLKFYKNGTQVGTTITDSDISSTEWSFGTQPRLATFSSNFGNGYFGTTAVASAGTNASGIGIFEYDVPTGYTSLSTKGLNL